MNKDLLIAVCSLMFISACIGFIMCFMAMGGFDDKKEPVIEKTFEGDTEITVEVHYDPPKAEAEAEETEVVTKTSLGRYRLTGYCPCEKCCGVNTGITASGTKATAGRTIGVNTSDIPYGSIIEINGQQYIAEDTGGAIGHNHIDIFFDTHEEAIAFGTQHAEVYLLEVADE